MQATRPVVETVFRKLGGREVLGQKVTSEADLARLVHRRIPLRALIYVKRGGFSDQEIGRFIIPERTQRHRKAKRQPLTVEESDRIVRLMRIQALMRMFSATWKKRTGGFAKIWQFSTGRRR